MDPKYLGKTVALPKHVTADLEKLRESLSIQFGFKLSLADTIAYLVRKHEGQAAR